MAYEKGLQFGNANGDNVTQTVSNHYGPRVVGHQDGVLPAKGFYTEAVVNFTGDAIDLPVWLPADSYVVGVVEDFAEGAVATATVGGTDVSTATSAAPVGPVAGELVVTGPTGGSVIIEYRHVADTRTLNDDGTPIA